MTTQLLIYERAVPVSSERHRDWSVKPVGDYGFARAVNAVPLLAAELPQASAEYPIVFAGPPGTVMPTAILGIREKENLYVDAEGRWTARYVPAFVRRYPFVFADGREAGTFTLCIDEEFAGCNTEGRGERLFDSDGTRTQYLEKVLGFVQSFQQQHQRTQAFGRTLEEAGVLEGMQAQVRLSGGRSAQLTGFSAVSRDKLKALGDERLGQLARSDELELLYLHLASLRHLAALGDRLPVEGAAGTATSETSPTAPADA